MSRPVKIGVWIAASLAGIVIAIAIAGVLVLQTPWFRREVRNRIVYEIENATGGRVELGQFLFDWHALTAEVRNLVIHGKEGPADAPLFRADSVRVTLRIISVLKKEVDLQSVVVTRPLANIIVYPDGHTNFPTPIRVSPRKRDPIQTVLDLAIKRFNIVDGAVQFALERMPVNVAGEDLRAQIFYEAGSAAAPYRPRLANPGEPRYRGDISFRALNVKPGAIKTLPFDMDAKLALSRNAVEMTSVHLGLKRSSFDFSGRVEDFASPRADVHYSAHVFAEDFSPALGIPAAPTHGAIDLGGDFRLSRVAGFNLAGKLRATGLAFQATGFRLANVSIDSDVAVKGDNIEFRGFLARALDGVYSGHAEIVRFSDFRVSGEARGFSIQNLAQFRGVEHVEWDGTASGPVEITGSIRNAKLVDFKTHGDLTVAPAAGQHPIEGRVDIRYDLNARRIDFGQSRLATRFSRFDFAGTLGARLNVAAETTNLDDIQPAITFAHGQPEKLPVALQPGGSAKFEGVVIGPLDSMSPQGRVAAANFTYEGRAIDSLTADAKVSKDGVTAQNLDVRRQQMRAAGWVRVGLLDWKADNRQPLSGRLSVQAPAIETLLAEIGREDPLSGGPLTADLTIAGTIGAPDVSARVTTGRLTAWEQPIGSLQAQVRYTEGLIQAPSAVVAINGSQVTVSGSYAYRRDDFREGRLSGEVSTRGVALNQLHFIAQQQQDIGGRLEAQLAGDINFDKAGFRINAVNGWAAVRGLVIEQEPIGSAVLKATTKGRLTTASIEGEITGAKVTGTSEWRLEGDYPVRGRLEFSPVRFDTLIERYRRLPTDLPFDGRIAGHVDFEGNTTQPESVKGTAEITELSIQPNGTVTGVANPERLAIRNAGPIVLDIMKKVLTVRQATLRGTDTELIASGRISFASKNPFDLRVRGKVNLAVLRNFDANLSSSGAAALDLSVRGRPSLPDIYGRIDLNNASLNWQGFPNGVDGANGLIFLYRDRATIDHLTARSGGGNISLSGFFSFAPSFTFHFAGKAEGVRVRYPEGVSSTANADLTLTGTWERSLLAGDVTVTRVGFNPRSDLGSILATAAEPVQTPARPNRFLQNMRLSVHIVTAPQVRLETRLTRELQADADLRLRGDPTRPVVLGRVSVNEGQIVFFGNQYDIQSGQILFVNAAKIEPNINLDLETRVRGIDVTLHVSGPVDKLTVTYRSDPPLQFSDIVTLLATGREPAQLASAPAAPGVLPQTSQPAGPSALLAQALANPIAGRLQRFFGVSRLKIDPQVTGITTNNAAARVTLEQQISRNISFTYITDLSKPQAQTIQVEFVLNKNWSAVTLREENGLFGVDLLYKKQIK